jgi:hypothetical protein
MDMMVDMEVIMHLKDIKEEVAVVPVVPEKITLKEV